MLHCQRLAGAAFTLLLRVKLADPASDGTFAKLYVFAYLADAQTLAFDHLSDLQLKAGVKGSSGFLMVHVCHHLGSKKTYRRVYLN